MKKANLTWYVKDEDQAYVSQNDFYAGSCVPSKDFILDLEIWNNRWNTTEDVENIQNCILTLEFINAEDSILFNYCSININNIGYQKINAEDLNLVSVKLGDILGQRNNGSSVYTNNYKSISVKFSNVPSNIKDGLKTLIFNIEHS